MILKCNKCGNSFKAERKSGKFCSPKCRKLAFQDKGVSVPETLKVSVLPVSVPKTPNGYVLGAVIPSLREDRETREVGKCSFCETDIKQEGDNWDLIECCIACSKPQKRRIHRANIKHLEDTSLTQLRADGEWIPNWRRNGFTRADVDKDLLDIIQRFPSCKWIFKGYVIDQCSISKPNK